jgi:hypothetical protein
MTSCTLSYGRRSPMFRRNPLPPLSGQEFEAVDSSEMSANTYHTTRYLNPHQPAWKDKISPTCVRRRPQSMLERSEGLADWTKHHLLKIQGIRPHVSGRLSDHIAQLGQSLPDGLPLSQQKSENYSSVQCGLVWKMCFCVDTIQRICLFRNDLTLSGNSRWGHWIFQLT